MASGHSSAGAVLIRHPKTRFNGILWMKRFLIIGMAKSGTTIISKTVQNTLGIPHYHLEPKTIAFFEELGSQEKDAVVKLIFDHWKSRLRLLNAIVHDELGTRFANNIFICRDPRAALVSRLHYVAFPFFSQATAAAETKALWLDVFRRKEDDPDRLSLREMIETMKERFGVDVSRDVGQTSEVYANYLSHLPESRKLLIKYEDFVAGRLDQLSGKALFTGLRDVGHDLRRTRRSGGIEDWKSFLVESDLDWLNKLFRVSLDAFGYEEQIEVGGSVAADISSSYVARLIDEAQALVPRETSADRLSLPRSAPLAG